MNPSFDHLEPGVKLPRPIPSDAWIAPNGDFHYVPFVGHSAFARKVLGEPDNWDPVGSLEARGWLHISGGTIYYKKTPNNRQLDVLFDLLVAYKNAAHSYVVRFNDCLQGVMERMDESVL